MDKKKEEKAKENKENLDKSKNKRIREEPKEELKNSEKRKVDKKKLEDFINQNQEERTKPSLKVLEIPDTTLKPIKNQPKFPVEENANLERQLDNGEIKKVSSTPQITYLPREKYSDYQSPEAENKKQQRGEPSTIINFSGPFFSAGNIFNRRRSQNINFQNEAARINENNIEKYESQPEVQFSGNLSENRDGLPFEDDRKYKDEF
jgi:hypothetical protein